MKQKIFFRVNEFRNDVEKLYEKGITRGVYAGYETLHEYYSIKMGVTTYIYGAPFSGKTEFWLDVLVTLSELYGYKHALYTPETGSKDEIVAELISKKARKPFYKQFNGHIEDAEYWQVIDWVNEYFFIIDPDTDITPEEFLGAVKDIEQTYDIRIDTTVCDPFNELKHNFKNDDGRQDLYIENRLGMIRRDAQKNKRHNAVITHVGHQELSRGKNRDGVEANYTPVIMQRASSPAQVQRRKRGRIG